MRFFERPFIDLVRRDGTPTACAHFFFRTGRALEPPDPRGRLPRSMQADSSADALSVCLAGWLAERLARRDQLAERDDWLADLWACGLVGWLAGWFAGWLAGWLACWIAGRKQNRRAEQLAVACWLAGCLAGSVEENRRAGRLAGWLADSTQADRRAGRLAVAGLAVWLVGWLVGRLNERR